jgi:hypothetical protein
MMAIEDVSAATTSSTKKTPPNTAPAGMLPKAIGSVTKTRPGPCPGSSPFANTSGNSATPASTATSVSAAPISEG